MWLSSTARYLTKTPKIFFATTRALSSSNRPIHALTDWYPYEKKFLERMANVHSFTSPLWLADTDSGFTFPTESGWDTVRFKPNERGFRQRSNPQTETLEEDQQAALFKRYFLAKSYFHVSQASNADSLIEYHRNRIPKCISRRLGFDTAVQAKLHEHAKAHNLRAQYWFTRKTLQKLHGSKVVLSPNATGVSLDIQSHDGKPTITLFNADQTTDPSCIKRRARRGHMENFHSSAKFHAEYQNDLHSYAEAHDLQSNLWVDQNTLQRSFQDISYPLPTAKGVNLELHRSEVGVVLTYFNADELANKDAVINAFKENTSVIRSRNFRTGAAYTFRVQKVLHAEARRRGFKSAYWVDVADMRRFQPPLELIEHDDGVQVEESNGKRAILYNLDQIRNGREIVAAYNKRSAAK